MSNLFKTSPSSLSAPCHRYSLSCHLVCNVLGEWQILYQIDRRVFSTQGKEASHNIYVIIVDIKSYCYRLNILSLLAAALLMTDINYQELKTMDFLVPHQVFSRLHYMRTAAR